VLTLPQSSVTVPRMQSSAQVRVPQVHEKDIRVGTAGWSYKDWEGVFYPPGMQQRKQHRWNILPAFSIRPKSIRRLWTAEARVGEAVVPQVAGGE